MLLSDWSSVGCLNKRTVPLCGCVFRCERQLVARLLFDSVCLTRRRLMPFTPTLPRRRKKKQQLSARCDQLAPARVWSSRICSDSDEDCERLALFKKCRRRRGREREDRCVESQRIDSTAAEGKTRRGTARRGDETERWELWGEGEFKMECFFIFFFPKMEKKYMRMQVWKQAADEGRSGELEKGTQCSDWREMRPYGKSTIDRKWLERKRSWWKNVS